jgi:ABC-type glycerol-3-phosphate transport system substrate-binding protein
MKISNKKKHKKTILALAVLVALFAIGAFAYNQVNDVVAETLITKVAVASADESIDAKATESVYNSMSKEDQSKVKEIAANHATPTNVKAVTEYLGNDDMAGLKEYAYDNLSSSEISQLQELYKKYN